MKKRHGFILISLCFLIFSGLLHIHGAVFDQSGFYQINPVRYFFHNGSYYTRIHHTTTDAQMWYTFLRADTDSDNKPLFLFFNGGPGSGTTCGLLGFYTARKTLDNRIFGGGDRYIDNPHSWTRLGNLLYIDARCTGFSYGLLGESQTRDFGTLAMEFTGRNFNSYIDAADYIRVLLRFLRDRPSIQGNPVVIVGESYGGVRTTLMLHMLLNYRGYGDGTEIFQDPELADMIQEHYDTIFPQYAGQQVPVTVIAAQFGRQVLIQPAIDTYQGQLEPDLLEQPGSIVYQIAAEVGQTFTPCTSSDCSRLGTIYNFIENIAGRDIYGCHKPAGWTDSFFEKGAELMSNSNQAISMTNWDIANIAPMYAAARSRAYKYYANGPEASDGPETMPHPNQDLSMLPEKEQYLFKSRLERFKANFTRSADSDFPMIFGVLLPWDAYFLSLNYDANYSYHYFTASVTRDYQSYSYNPLTGRKFLQNLVHVKTFITNAKYDLVVYTNALPIALNRHDDIVEQSTHLMNSPEQLERPGLIEIRYRSGAFQMGENIGVRTIRFPFYTQSAHPVSLTEPREFYDDVAAWLQD